MHSEKRQDRARAASAERNATLALSIGPRRGGNRDNAAERDKRQAQPTKRSSDPTAVVFLAASQPSRWKVGGDSFRNTRGPADTAPSWRRAPPPYRGEACHQTHS